MSETPDELRALVRELRQDGWMRSCSLPIQAADAIDALLARLATAEADADRLADDLTCAQEQWGDQYLWQKCELDSALRLHAEAVARREQP
jgi:hypothetical protein